MGNQAYSTDYDVQEMDHRGCIPQSIEGMYTETVVINYTEELIYIQTSNGEETCIDCTYRGSGPRRVDIMIRKHNGMRKFDIHRNETWAGKVTHITIQWEKMRKIPVFVAEINQIIYSEAARGFASHPVTNKSLDAAVRDIDDNVKEAFKNSPLTVLANDPTGDYKVGYIAVGGSICEFDIQDMPDHPFTITLCIRDNNLLGKYRYTDLDTDKLFEEGLVEVQDGRDGNFIISLSEDKLRATILNNRSRLESMFDSKTLEEYKSQVDATCKSKINNLKDKIDLLTADMANIEKRHKQDLDHKDLEIEKLKYKIKMCDIDFDHRAKFANYMTDSNKATSQIHIADANAEIARLKAEKEKLSRESAKVSNIGTYAKVAAVLVPLAIAGIAWVWSKVTSASQLLNCCLA